MRVAYPPLTADISWVALQSESNRWTTKNKATLASPVRELQTSNDEIDHIVCDKIIVQTQPNHRKHKLHRENDIVVSTKRFFNVASANQNRIGDNFSCYINNMNCYHNKDSFRRNKWNCHHNNSDLLRLYQQNVLLRQHTDFLRVHLKMAAVLGRQHAQVVNITCTTTSCIR